MRCSWMKWEISQSCDSRKNLPGYVERHLARCASCRRFAQASLSISAAGKRSNISFPEDLNEKIIRKIRQNEIAPAQKVRIPRSVYIGLSAAAAGILIIIFLPVYSPFRQKNEMRDIPPLLKTHSIASMGNKMSSPYEREIGFIGNALSSIAEKVISAADPQLSFRSEKGEKSILEEN